MMLQLVGLQSEDSEARWDLVKPVATVTFTLTEYYSLVRRIRAYSRELNFA